MPLSHHRKQPDRLVGVDHGTAVHLVIGLRGDPLDVIHRVRRNQSQLDPVPKRAVEDGTLAGNGRRGLLAVQT
jgi:hypothetical protein